MINRGQNLLFFSEKEQSPETQSSTIPPPQFFSRSLAVIGHSFPFPLRRSLAVMDKSATALNCRSKVTMALQSSR